MQSTIAIVGLFAQLGLGMFSSSPIQSSALIGRDWSIHSISTPLLHQLTQGQSLTFATTSRSSLDGEPRVTQIYPVHSDILAVEIETGAVIRGKQEPYVAQAGDRIDPEKGQLRRNGQALGILVNQERVLYTYDRYVGSDLSVNWAESSNSFRLSSSTDPSLKTPQPPVEVFYKSKPTDMAETANGNRYPKRNTLYLKLPDPLQAGESYTLTFRGLPLEPETFTYNPQVQRSEAVHVSQVGFRPHDPVKIGFLSTWMGQGGGVAYAEGMTFWLIDDQTDQIVYEGQTRLSVAQDTPEDPLRNYNQTDVYALDFHDFDQPGTYRLCVETVGCSFSFPIERNVWHNTFYTSIRGLYHQRSGIEIGPPYSHYQRPRAFHPDDGVAVYQSGAKLMDTNMGIGRQRAFDALVEKRTETTLPDAWGGYFDAGDWDRRIQHLGIAQSLMELWELHADKLATVDLNIPESDNQLPDLLDEALWTVDFYQRLQKPDGGVPGGVESAKHPRKGEASWQESLQVMAYAPDIWSSYWYASAAAQAAYVVEPFDAERARAYRESAQKAFEYAEGLYPNPPQEKWPRDVRDLRNLAALELWRLTEDDRWHQIFLEDTAFAESGAPLSKQKQYSQGAAAFLYSRLELDGVDPAIQENARQAVLEEADRVARLSTKTAFQWSKEHPRAPVGYGTSWASPGEARVIAWAHYLTQEEKYLAAILRTTQFPLGANPDNLVFTTGLGMRSPLHPLILDQRAMGVDAPPGITVYGPMDISHKAYQDYWFTDHFVHDQMVPEPRAWPPTELHIDAYMNVGMSEFTVQQTIAPSAYVWGYLAAQD